MTFRTPDQVTHGAPHSRRYPTDQARDYADFYSDPDAYPESVPASITVGAEVVGRLGSEPEVGSWGAGRIEWISVDRSRVAVLWPNGEGRTMDASDVDFGLDRPVTR